MITKHCLLKAHYQREAGPCIGKYCQTAHGLKDRKGKVMPLRRVQCHMEILNHEHLILLEKLNDLIKSGISRFRLEFRTETIAEIEETIKVYLQGLNGMVTDQEWLAKYHYTIGHYNRGVQ